MMELLLIPTILANLAISGITHTPGHINVPSDTIDHGVLDSPSSDIFRQWLNSYLSGMSNYSTCIEQGIDDFQSPFQLYNE